MKRLVLPFAAAAAAVAAVPALAQQPQGPGPGSGGGFPGPMWGYGHMWGGGWGDGWHGGFFFHPLLAILAFVGFLALLRWVFFGFRHGCPYHGRWRHRRYGGGSEALDILEERLARGEIGK